MIRPYKLLVRILIYFKLYENVSIPWLTEAFLDVIVSGLIGQPDSIRVARP